jgi:hypothetical protein
MSDKTAIFQSENTESPLQVIRQTMSVSLSGDGVPQVAFATNRGKGSGTQVIDTNDFVEAVSTLQGYADDGIEEREEETLSPAETIRRTIRVEDGVVSFRTRSGKGSKPAKIPVAMFSEVCELLTGTVSAVLSAGQSLAPSEDDSDESPIEDASDSLTEDDEGENEE